MLVLSRKRNEVICIGETIQVIVLGAKKGMATLGIVAPAGVKILRGEFEPKKEGERT